MSDWQVGDLALCVKSGPWSLFATGAPSFGPPHGSISTVSWVGLSADGLPCLLFKEFQPQRTGKGISPWLADRFRRIPPLTPEEHASYIIQLSQDQRVTEKAR